MGLWSKLTGGTSASTTTAGRTTADNRRRNKQIRDADAETAAWLRNGGLAPKKRG